MTDEITLTRSVLAVGDYFSLITTIVIDPATRLEGEDENEQAVREASAFMLAHYGWDIEGASNDIGVIDDE